MTAIEVRGLTKRFGPVLAVDGLSFAVGSGTVAGFLGPNGAGKTTTLRMLLGLVAPTSGTATVNGALYRALPDPSRQVGAVLEASGIHPGRTARGHLRVRAAAAGLPRARADAVLDMVGLAGSADRRVGSFSLGMRQRLALAAAMLGDPGLLILDEPANGLDPQGVRWLRGLLRGLAREGRTVLVSSHVLAEIAQIVDEVIILNKGRLVTHSPLADLTARTRQIVHVRTPAPAELKAGLAGQGLRAGVTEDGRIEVSGATPEEVAELAARLAVPVFECVAVPAQLEDMFLQLTATPEKEMPR